jgi:pyridoxamine 5'-phosphate oxidase
MSFITVDSDPYTIVQNTWQMLIQGKKTYNSPFHCAQVATVNEQQGPEVRTMILREVDEVNTTICFNLDIRSHKAHQIINNPNVQCLFYDESARVQLRLTCTGKICYKDDVADTAWQKARMQSKLAYNTIHAPGSRLTKPIILDVNKTDATPKELETAKNNFAVLLCKVANIDILSLHHISNLRIGYDCQKKEAYWLHP